MRIKWKPVSHQKYCVKKIMETKASKYRGNLKYNV